MIEIERMLPATLHRRGSRGAAPAFRTLLGEADWARLAAPIQARFAATTTLADFEGEAELEASFAGRALAQILRAVGGPLPWIVGAAAARVTIRKQADGAVWDRSFRRPGGRWIHVRSLKRVADGRLFECAGPIWMRLRLAAAGSALAFHSDGFFLALGPVRLRLPGWLTPGALTVLHTDAGEGRFVFALTCDHPLFGWLYRQTIRLADAPVQGGGHA
ncbi:MAG: DUF4166 domain-containing protein [Oceanicaulis sp.]